MHACGFLKRHAAATAVPGKARSTLSHEAGPAATPVSPAQAHVRGRPCACDRVRPAMVSIPRGGLALTTTGGWGAPHPDPSQNEGLLSWIRRSILKAPPRLRLQQRGT